jgi:hypothetical protein
VRSLQGQESLQSEIVSSTLIPNSKKIGVAAQIRDPQSTSLLIRKKSIAAQRDAWHQHFGGDFGLFLSKIPFGQNIPCFLSHRNLGVHFKELS